MRLKTLAFAAAAAAATTVAGAAAPAFAGSGTISPTTNLVGNQQVSVTYTGFANNVFITQCQKSITNAQFDPAADCDFDRVGLGQSAPGTTSRTVQYTVFSGPSNLGFACGTTTNATDFPVVPCFIRVVDTSYVNTTGAFEAPITFATTVVPEVPYAALLPIGAIGAIGAVLFLNRRKAALNAA